MEDRLKTTYRSAFSSHPAGSHPGRRSRHRSHSAGSPAGHRSHLDIPQPGQHSVHIGCVTPSATLGYAESGLAKRTLAAAVASTAVAALASFINQHRRRGTVHFAEVLTATVASTTLVTTVA